MQTITVWKGVMGFAVNLEGFTSGPNVVLERVGVTGGTNDVTWELELPSRYYRNSLLEGEERVGVVVKVMGMRSDLSTAGAEWEGFR